MGEVEDILTWEECRWRSKEQAYWRGLTIEAGAGSKGDREHRTLGVKAMSKLEGSQPWCGLVQRCRTVVRVTHGHPNMPETQNEQRGGRGVRRPVVRSPDPEISMEEHLGVLG